MEDQTRPGWSLEELCRKYKDSLLEEYIRSFGEKPDEEAEESSWNMESEHSWRLGRRYCDHKRSFHEELGKFIMRDSDFSRGSI